MIGNSIRMTKTMKPSIIGHLLFSSLILRNALTTGKLASLLFLIGLAELPLPADTPANTETDRIYQYFIPSDVSKDRPNLGAYLWIPPHTPKIRAVMIGMHNGLPINILQSEPMRAVCRRQGIAQILMTPWAKDIGSVMLKDLDYDITDPERTAIYDGYLQRLANLSGHPELVTAPIVPLAHSAYCSFPLDAAMRKPEQCLAAIPIKAGLPDVYSFYAPGGKAKTPSADLCLRNVPILFVSSASQETVGWSAYPHGLGSVGLGSYRRDHDDNPGTSYEPHNELFGVCWDMMSGHFDMFPRDYQFVADWLDAVASARLPAHAGDPLKNLTLADGWLMNPQIPATGDLPKDYPEPAPYLQYKGHRNQALWFPNEKLARELFTLADQEPRKKIELFTFLDPTGQPISLAHGLMASLPNPQALLYDNGLFKLTTCHFTSPPDISTIKDYLKHPEIPDHLENVLFPGQTTLPLSNLPLQYNSDDGALELVSSEQFKDERGVTETRLILKLKRRRIDPSDGFNMSFVRVFDEGNDEFAAAGRTCQISLSPGDAVKNGTEQKVDFPAIADTPGTTQKIALQAQSSAGLPVDYFIFKGPGIIQDGAFIPEEIPEGTTQPIEVTIGAYQVGLFKETGGVKPSATVYQTFHLLPPFSTSE